MKSNTYNYLAILILLILSASCTHAISELEARRKNDEGLVEFNNRRLDNAIVLFKDAMTHKDISVNTLAMIYRNTAQVYMDMELQDSAIHYSTLAANCFEKDSYEHLVSMADVQLLNDEVQVAITTLERAYKLKPKDMPVNNSLGLIYLGQYGYDFLDLEKALLHNKQAFAMNRDGNTEYLLARNYYELERFPEAEKHFKNLSKEYPENLDHTIFLGMIKYKLGAKTEAEEHWNNVLAINPDYQVVIDSFKDEEAGISKSIVETEHRD